MITFKNKQVSEIWPQFLSLFLVYNHFGVHWTPLDQEREFLPWTGIGLSHTLVQQKEVRIRWVKTKIEFVQAWSVVSPEYS